MIRLFPITTLWIICTATWAQPPRIVIASPSGTYWYNPVALVVRALVESDEGIQSLTINGVEQNIPVGEVRIVHDTRIVLDDDLKEVNTELHVVVSATAGDGATHTEEKALRFSPIELETSESRIKLAVLAGRGNAPGKTPDDFRTILESVLSQSKRFSLLERMVLSASLAEQQLPDSASDIERPLTLGKHIPAHVFLIPQIDQAKEGFRISLQAVDAKNADLLFRTSFEVQELKYLEQLRDAAENAVRQLVERFPRLTGEVLAARDNRLLIDLGMEDGIWTGQRVMCLVKGDPVIDSDTGEMLYSGLEDIVGEGIVSLLFSNTSVVEIIQQSGVEVVTIDPGTPVITM